jgi:voltage-gated potassium channel Kch
MIAGASHSIRRFYPRCRRHAIRSCLCPGRRAVIAAPQHSGVWGIRQDGQPDVIASTRRSVVQASDRLWGSPLRNLIVGVFYMLVVMAAAVIAYVLAGWSVGDALYMVIVTVYTVGYGEVRPITSPALREITIGTIVLGCTGMIYLTGALVQFITLNQINQMFGIKRMSSQIDRLRGHVIVCGFGRIGMMLAQGLHAGGAAFVILEPAEPAAAMARSLGYLCLQADATDEAALRAAGIEHARTLATVLSNDALNVFITLSARSLNPGLDIIARGELPSTESKLMQAGANKVVLPTHIGAERIAEMILYQETARFIRGSDRMRDFEKVLLSLGLDIQVVVAAPKSAAIGKTIETIEQQGNGAFFIVQINRRDGEAVTRPESSTVIADGDGLVLVGRGGQAKAVGALFEAGGRTAFRVSAR